MTPFDYVIVGAGPAGCVLANRLSADPGVNVLPGSMAGDEHAAVVAKRLGDDAMITLVADHDANREILLVRPDAHLGWRGRADPAALDRWLTAVTRHGRTGRIPPRYRLASLWLSCDRRRHGAAGEAVRATDGEDLGPLLDEQRAYYRALAADYLDQGLDLPGGDEVAAALDAFQPTGSVLELACGPGVWTGQLLRYASDVTAVDASPEMLAIAAARVGIERVRFIEADLFTWKPDRRYDVVFFGFWLSHVPAERFASFWSLVASCLKPEGRVFFADDAYRTPDELVEGPSSSTIRRQVPDGTAYRLVKVPRQPADLERRLRQLGWHINVTSTAGPFYWGAGSRGLHQA